MKLNRLLHGGLLLPIPCVQYIVGRSHPKLRRENVSGNTDLEA